MGQHPNRLRPTNSEMPNVGTTMKKAIHKPCPECGKAKGRRIDGDHSECAACGGNRYRIRISTELTAAIDAHHGGTGTADAVVTEAFNQDFGDIVNK